MAEISDLYQKADWKTEKHVPVIEFLGKPEKDQETAISVCVGKEIPHPNTTEHHIEWIEIYFLPQEEKYPYLLGKFTFDAHGASVQGPNTSTIYSSPDVNCKLKTGKSGYVIAVSYCNIHGLWTSSEELNF
ncbi:MAG: superoxide reductase [Actinobacteria bacterium]|nr:superoxide reductase [Actinomycetota bacterium]